MKKVYLGILMVLPILLFSGFIVGDNEHDVKLVGVWKGSEKNMEQEGIEKHWILQRYENGKYVIMFTYKDGCDVETLSEKGEWWTKEGKFYEKNGSHNTDIYSYEVVNDNVVYKSIELNGEKRTDYNFTDYKINLD
jgi:hypothetical protein